MIRKIISGGQTGADQGGLVAGRQLGIETGGWMPRGFLTEVGPCPELAGLYGVQEHPSSQYPPRTRQNVRDADGTVWVGDPGEADSRGKVCTLRACEDFQKPVIVNPDAEALRHWVSAWGIQVLNVAGPRASRDRNAHRRAAELLIEALGR